MISLTAQEVELQKLSKNSSVFLEDAFRKQLIEKAIKKAGSMRQLGRVMGYSASSPNWSIKQIIKGNQGIPFFRLEKLCDFLKISLEEIKKNIREIKKKTYFRSF